MVGLSYLAGQVASVNIQRTQELRVPTALASANAQENLLKMLSNIRAYLATGKPEYRYRYQQTRQDFEADLAELERLFSVRNASQNWQLTAQEIKQAVIDDVRKFIGKQKVFDDITLVVLKQQ